ncbi:MAG: metal ABC transporter permease [Cytophagales bacterium]|nr:metal ABC transporter permease [Cytophagales bacterium]
MYFSDPNIRYVTLGCLLLTGSAAVVGCFAFLRKKSLLGDALAHAVLPGVCLGFMLAGAKNPVYLLAGAFVTGWLSVYAIDAIVRHTKLKEDTAVGLVLSVFFGVGILLLTSIQQNGNAAQSGLDHFLFGKAASLLREDVLVFGAVALALVAAIVLFYKELKLLCFDENFARAIGLPVRRLEWLLTSLTVLAVVTGIQAVGVVLMAAILITPAAAARCWTNRLGVMVVLSAVFGGIAALTGTAVSFAAPAMPTGPWMVMTLFLIAMVSFGFAPGRGLVPRWLRQYRNRWQIAEDNLLKAFYQLGEQGQDFRSYYPASRLLEHRPVPASRLNRTLRRLRRDGYLRSNQTGWALTSAGQRHGQRITRLHRLWELYLTQYLRIAPDHVHEDAEMIEHIITPEIELKLQELLQYPQHDPHQTKIPN